MRIAKWFKNCFICGKKIDNNHVAWACTRCWKNHNDYVWVPDYISVKQEEEYCRIRYSKRKENT